MLSLPIATMPAAAALATQARSAVFAGSPANSFEPAVVGAPATSKISFQPIGTPSSGDSGSLRR